MYETPGEMGENEASSSCSSSSSDIDMKFFARAGLRLAVRPSRTAKAPARLTCLRRGEAILDAATDAVSAGLTRCDSTVEGPAAMPMFRPSKLRWSPRAVDDFRAGAGLEVTLDADNAEVDVEAEAEVETEATGEGARRHCVECAGGVIGGSVEVAEEGEGVVECDRAGSVRSGGEGSERPAGTGLGEGMVRSDSRERRHTRGTTFEFEFRGAMVWVDLQRKYVRL
jgi:hypothetical protein